MPRIFDNIDQKLLPALQDTLNLSQRSDFCVGYFNLRGWKQLDSYIEKWAGGDGNCCRLLVGMQRAAQEELRDALGVMKRQGEVDAQTVTKLKKKLAEEFREQLAIGIPTNADEAGLRRLAAQIKANKVRVKLFLRHPLHAKLYLLFRQDPISPIVGYLGSSNLTFAGLSQQGELNLDVLDHDACQKLSKWFEDRWNDNRCLDISDELVQIIESSWAREELIPPYHIYIKMAYHLSQEARAGLSEFKIPKEFGNTLFEFQTAAVKIAAHHLNKRNGVIIGDVVGLGKTLMATAVAKIFEDDHGLETLILCPKNLVKMWEDYQYKYRMHAKVLSISKAIRELPKLKRYRLVLLDESHNLRNREGKRYKIIQEYIQTNDSKVIMLSATPYNKTYLDLSNQLRLFIPDDKDLGARPEKLIKEIGETEFIRKHQCAVRSLAAFEKSEYADDWRDLMRLYLVRRTRSFIVNNYADTDSSTGRKFLTFSDGRRSYFPTRVPKTITFSIDEKNLSDQYGRLYDSRLIDIINHLNLPRYGLGNYIEPLPHNPPTQAESKPLQDLSRAGKRLMGFCRTNLFKRLESSGQAFIQSIERHILRNFVFLHAIDEGLPLPIGTQGAEFLDSRFTDADEDIGATTDMFEDEEGDEENGKEVSKALRTEDDFKLRAKEVYDEYQKRHKKRFKWLRSDLFGNDMAKDLKADSHALFKVLEQCGEWDPSKDTKLESLVNLLTKRFPKEKVLIFTQFADTVNYVTSQLRNKGITKVGGATGDSSNPTMLAWQFSPVSNDKRDEIKPSDELRVLIATDVLSEGQNLQDCAIVVNYDLPWAIIRLIQRVGRVDRIGQQAETIYCYSFLPADGVDKIIKLRARVRQRLKENAEVVGTDEAFFEDDRNDQKMLDLYHEKAGILDADDDTEVDLASYAYQIWKNAITEKPELQKLIPEMSPVVYSTKEQDALGKKPEGALVYLRTPEGNDALAWIDKNGASVTESQLAVLRAAECKPNTIPLPRLDNHHELVERVVRLVIEEEKAVGGQLGRPSGARFKTYERLKRYADEVKGTLFDTEELKNSIDEIYCYPLKQSATDALNRQLRSGISDDDLTRLVVALRDEGRLCQIHEDEEATEPRIICSLGLSKK